jgi:tetratricopeptide (TPR) repeat protein
VNDPAGEIEALYHLGLAVLETDDPRAALSWFEEGLPLARRLGRAVSEARILDGVARCRELLGEPEAALEPLRVAVAMYRRMGLAELAGAEARLVALEAAGPVGPDDRDGGSAIATPSRR